MPEGVGYGPQDTASIGRDLHVIGNRAYAYAGTSDCTTSALTVISFTSGNYLFEGKIFGSGAVNYVSGNLTDGKFTAWKISLNEQVVGFLLTDSQQEDMPNEATMPIIIPPYTQVKIETLCNGASSSELITTSITGRIYK